MNQSSKIRPFHLALPVTDLSQVRQFYGEILQCSFGREDTHWIDVNFFNHQVVFHQQEGFEKSEIKNNVDSKLVPVPHFGVILTPSEFTSLATHLKTTKNITFEIEPYTRFKGEPGEQSTMFFYDPNGYALEFKALGDDRRIFETE